MKFAKFLYIFLIQATLSSVLSLDASNTVSPDSNHFQTDDLDIDSYNVSTGDNSRSSSSPSFSRLKDEKPISNGLQADGNNVPDDAVQVTEIHSSFEEVTKSDVPKEKIAVNNRPPVLLNQGTVSEEFSDSETLGILSVTDSATAELQNHVVSMSTDVKVDASSDTLPKKNVTNEPPPPIIILPPGDSGFSFSSSNVDARTKTTAPPDDSQTAEQSQPPVVRAEPKILTKVEDLTQLEQDADTVPSGAESSSDSVNPKTSEPTTASPPASTIDLVGVPTSESPHEEIPSFSEWTQKQLEEAEKKKVQNKTSSSSPTRVGAPPKVRSKNYASPDCGAKIVASNAEAENPNGVLSTSKDEYVLNKCSTQRKWLIIELCEPIQAEKLELANFELFSSSPKDFSVSLSHNFPSREWSSVGQFTAQDERVSQSFNLHPHLFGKFLRVDFNTHYGHEHFCCTSLIRVYGTSEFEVLETESDLETNEEDDDEDEQPIGADMGKPTKNLFGHATEAVYSIVKKAAEVLVNSGDSRARNSLAEQQNISAIVPALSTPTRHCSTLRHLVVCNNCSEDFFDKVYNLLSCQPREMQALIETPFVLDGINSSQLCSIYGLDFILRRSGPFPPRIKHEDQLDHAGYLAAMLPAEYISALCNILAVLEGKVVLNNSHAGALSKDINLTIRAPKDTRDLGFKKIIIEPEVAPTCSMDESFSSTPCQSRDSKTASDEMGGATTAPESSREDSHLSIASMIKPTKTLSKEEYKMESDVPSDEAQVPISVPLSVASPKGTSEPSFTIAQLPNVNSLEHRTSPTDIFKSGSASSIIPDIATPDPPVLELPPTRDVSESGDGLDSGASEEQEQARDLDAIFSEMKALDSNEEATTESNPSTTISSVVTQTRVPAQQTQKESVFLRLSNRIKALERNMSLSGQYLEELSRRYKKQEELSRALNKTLVLLREEVKRSREREIQKENDMNFLKSKVLELSVAVESLHAEQGSWQQKAAVVSQHLVVIVVEVLLFGLVVWICRRLPSDTSAASPPYRKLSSMLCKGNRPNGKPRRRNSFEGVRCSNEHKERRPSEELLYISGSYQDLLLQNDKVVVVEGVDLSPGADTSSWSSVSNRDQRRKRKRRKDGLVKSNSSENLAICNSNSSRKISAPSHSFSLCTQSTIEDSTHQEPSQYGVVPTAPSSFSEHQAAVIQSESADIPSSFLNKSENGVSDIVRTIPSFMETASSARSRRSFNMGEVPTAQMVHPILDWNNGYDGESGSSVSHQSSQSRGLDDQTSGHTSAQSDVVPAVGAENRKKKNSKKGGLKNMVKKFF